MKRVVIILILLIAVLLGVLYFGIASTQSFTAVRNVTCNSAGALRMLLTKNTGWPGEQLNDSSYRFANGTYSIQNSLINSAELLLKENNASGRVSFFVEQLSADSSRFTISHASVLSKNPVIRVQQYFGIKKIKQSANQLLEALASKFADETIVYGIKIERTRVKDSAMVSMKQMLNHYPTTNEVYAMVDQIRAYIEKNGGEENNAPMLNVYKESASSYLVMAAIPAKTSIPSNETFVLKKMLVNGFILVSEVTGGTHTILQGEEAMKQYVVDHQKSSPAIPFQLLLTDRRAEPDTTRWKTRLYYPVMY